MAFEEYDEFEQEQAVKEWIKNNWLTIASGIVLGLGGVFGINFWKQNEQEKRFAAASEYEKFTNVMNLQDFDEAQNVMNEFKNEFGDNFFTYEGRLLLAKEFIKKNELEKAATQLQAVVDSKPDKSITEFVKLRLARVNNAQGKYDEALSLVNSITSDSYQSIAKEIEGDAYSAQGKKDSAKSSYQKAYDEGEGYSGKRNIEMKLQNS